jgi:hypothetical protein
VRMLEPHDFEIVAIVRRLPRGLAPRDREALARYAQAYVRSFLRAWRSRSRFGFQRPFGEVVDDVAAWEVAPLLCPMTDGDEGGRLQLEILLARVLDLSASADDELLFFFRRLLRTRGEHGLVAEWKREHPDQARLLKRFKRLLKMNTDLRIQRDPRGRLVVSSVSRLDLPQVPDRELDCLLADFHLPLGARVGELASVLKPGDGHGGWCYLLDLVRAASRIHQDAVTRDPQHTGAEPAGPSSRLTRAGVPLDLWADRIRQSLGTLAEQCLHSDARKAAARKTAGGREEDDGGPNAAYVQVCVEMICRGYGLGRPDWGHLSQAELLRRLLPIASKTDASATDASKTDAAGTGASETEEMRHRTRADYLIRRVRGVWEARTPPASLDP